MSVALKSNLKQTNKLAMTQSLRQAIDLLALSNLELADMISEVLLDNPVLEETVPSTSKESDSFNNPSSEDYFTAEVKKRDDFFSEDSTQNEKYNYLEEGLSFHEGLIDHLLWQAQLTAKTPEEYNIFADIITSLNDDGFLIEKLDNLAKENKVSLVKIKKILTTINFFDPPGCGAKNVQESLLIQAHHFLPEDKEVQIILENYFEDFKHLDYEVISKKTRIKSEVVLEKMKIIQSFLPYPGRLFSSQKIKYILPDLEVKLIEDEVKIILNDSWLPRLRINSFYRHIFEKDNGAGEKALYLKEKMVAANFFLKNIVNRRTVVLKVATYILEEQKDFLLKGPGNLKPLTHHFIAQKINMHESTISRVVNNKYIQTPWGIFELKYFFVSKLKNNHLENKDQSSDKVKNFIKHTIKNENYETPLSDEQIVEILKKNSIEIARRTVTKYRVDLKIPNSNTRKKINKFKEEDYN